MLRAFGPDCNGEILDAGEGVIPPGATWIDLEEPTREEEKLVERLIGLEVPTPEDLAEIEPSSRLYELHGALYMTMSVLFGITEGKPTSCPIGFVLTGDRLVTIRYATPKPVMIFMDHVRREPAIARDAATVLVRLLDAIIDRLADELENSGRDIEHISHGIFRENMEERRIPAHRLTALLTKIGRAQSLLARIRETAVSTSRLLSFLHGSGALKTDAREGARSHATSLSMDVSSLMEHSTFLGDNLTFLLDASLGLISVEQNAAMKVFSWVAVVLMPPTLIAGIYGMNFRNFPELEWSFGYPMAIGLMLLSAILPFAVLKRLGWI